MVRGGPEVRLGKFCRRLLLHGQRWLQKAKKPRPPWPRIHLPKLLFYHPFAGTRHHIGSLPACVLQKGSARAWPSEGRGSQFPQGPAQGGAGALLLQGELGTCPPTGPLCYKRKSGKEHSKRRMAQELGISQWERSGSQSLRMGVCGCRWIL